MNFWFYLADGMSWPLIAAIAFFSITTIVLMAVQDGVIKNALPGKYTKEELYRAWARMVRRQFVITLLLVVALVASRSYVKAQRAEQALSERAP
jgi:uncharacterized membrane protein YjgN (DUF898 family)